MNVPKLRLYLLPVLQQFFGWPSKLHVLGQLHTFLKKEIACFRKCFHPLVTRLSTLHTASLCQCTKLSVYDLKVITAVVVIHQLDIQTCTAQNWSQTLLQCFDDAV